MSSWLAPQLLLPLQLVDRHVTNIPSCAMQLTVMLLLLRLFHLLYFAQQSLSFHRNFSSGNPSFQYINQVIDFISQSQSKLKI